MKEMQVCVKRGFYHVFTCDMYNKGKDWLTTKIVCETANKYNQYYVDHVRIPLSTCTYNLDKYVDAGILETKKDGNANLYRVVKDKVFPAPEEEISKVSKKKEEKKEKNECPYGDVDAVSFVDAMMALNDNQKIKSLVTNYEYKMVDRRITRIGCIQSIKPEFSREEMEGSWMILYDVPNCPICGHRSVVLSDRTGYFCQCLRETCGCRMRTFKTRTLAIEQFRRKDIEEEE